jgi:putative nucleotidyltransferase with HDIG domain
MLGFFERQRLVKKGLAPQKTRRRVTESEVLDTMEHGIVAKWLLLAVAAGLYSWLIFYKSENFHAQTLMVGVLMFATGAAHLCLNRPEVWGRNSRMLLLFLVMLAHLGAMKWCFLSSFDALTVSGNIAPNEMGRFAKRDMWQLAVPFSLAPLLISVLLGRAMGVFATVFCTLMSIPVLASVDADYSLVVTNVTTGLVCGFISVFLTLDVRRRSDLLRSGLFVGLSTWVMGVMFQKLNLFLIHKETGVMDWNGLLTLSAVAVGSPIVLTLLISGALPPIEGLFRITTRVRWLEMADLNHPLLKRMTLEAPGTFQHSLAVANLAEAACEAIGANATMARVCSYFHDVGKLVKPEYFTENMRHDRNPHDDLAPTMSALIIVAHVKEGVSLALEHKLAQEIIDVIQQHHGTSLVFYFYKKALDLQETARGDQKIASMHDEDLPEVSESSFRYGGPKPQTKESAIISLADSIESASRSLERVTPQKLEQLITDIIRKRVADGQLDDCNLQFNELQEVAESFRHTLSSMMHSRVAYPDDKDTKVRRHDRSEHSSIRSKPDATAA